MAERKGRPKRGSERQQKPKAVQAKPPEPPPTDKRGESEDGSRVVPLSQVVTAASVTAVSLLTGFVWISDKFEDVRKDMSDGFDEVGKNVAEANRELTRHGSKLDELDRRMDRLEDRFNAKFGADDVNVPDAAAPDARVWDPDHVERREKFCGKKCATDAVCTEKCAADYNACGIRCPSDIRSDCFLKCVEAIK